MPSICAEAPLHSSDPSAYLPHRFPFLFLDRITALEPGVGASAIRQITALPGSCSQIFLVESLAQLAGIAAIGDHGDRAYLAAIDAAEFNGAPQPGETLTLRVSVVKSFGMLHLVEGEAWSGERLLLKAKLTVGTGGA